MTAIAPRISSRLRKKVEAIVQNPSFLVDRTYSVLMESDEEYASLPSVVRRDVLDSIRLFAVLWFRCIAEERFVSEAELDSLAAVGARRVHQGIGLNSLLRAFRTGGREILSVYLALGREDESLRDELLFDLSPFLLDYVDNLSQAIAQAFLAEQFQGSRWRDARRYELCSIIFGAPHDLEGFQNAASALGIDAHSLRVALAFDLDLSDISAIGIESELDRFTLAIARPLAAQQADLIRVMRHGRLVIWVPCARGDSIILTDQRMRKLMAPIAQTNSLVRDIGVGLMNQGPEGWATSASEAIRAIEIGASPASKNHVHLYSEIVVNESVRGTKTALRYLDSLIERIGHESELIPTLEAYFKCSQRRKTTAAALSIHPNTLTYRLDRVENLLGIKLADLEQLAKLNIALKLRREGNSVVEHSSAKNGDIHDDKHRS